MMTAPQGTMPREGQLLLPKNLRKKIRHGERGVPVGVFTTTPEGACNYVNSAFEQITDIAAKHILRKRWTDRIHPEDTDRVIKAWARAKADKASFNAEFRIKRKRQAIGWVSVQVIPQLEHHRLAGYIGTVTDITARKRTEHTLRELHSITSSADLNSSDRINAMLSLGIEIFGQPTAVLSRMDGTNYLVKEAVSPSPLIRKGMKLDPVETYCNDTMHSNDPIVFEQATNTRWAKHPCYTRHNINSYLGTRLTVEGRNYGTLSFSSTEPANRTFDQQDRELLNLMAQWVASEIQRNQAEERLAQSEQQFEQIAYIERALGKLLQLSISNKPMKQYLNEVLTTLFGSVPWLKLQPKGGIYLKRKSDPDHLYLTASHQMDNRVEKWCRKVNLESCLCGNAAQEKHPVFASCTAAHASSPSNSGQYNMPILAENDLLGMIVLYLQPNCIENDHNKDFLKRVSDVIGMGIKKRYAEKEIEHYAYHDMLTGLPNRRLLTDHLSQENQSAQRHKEFGALFFIDLDNFKTLNDAKGHAVGDTLLRSVAVRLKRQIRSVDIIARLGGDEFGIIATRLSKDREKAISDAHNLAEKIKDALCQPYDLGDQELEIGASIGIALFPEMHRSAEDMLSCADTAMYRAKSDGRNQIRFFEDDMQALADSRLALERDLSNALKKDEFSLYYQPQVGVRGELLGVEALVRWQCSRRGELISPAEFIPLAEENGMILPLGSWVMETAIRQYHDWYRDGLIQHDQTIAINISPKEFLQPNLIQRIQKLLNRYQVPGKCIKLEITEGIVISNLDQCISTMKQLRELGIGISIDDFGTGYSSLAYLRHLPIDQLKIDQSFVKDLPHEQSAGRIVETIISMADHLELNLIAEGVETEGQWDYLTAWGCQAFQGYLLSRPLSPSQARTYLTEQKHRH